jgi:hypothetical protein
MSHLAAGIALMSLLALVIVFDKKMQQWFTEHPASALLLELAAFCAGIVGIMQVCVGLAQVT